VGLLIDLNLTAQALGPNTSALIGETQQFLAGLKQRQRIQSYSVDAFSQNTQENLDAGRWYVAVSVKLYAAADEIVLVANIGEGVEISA
jgi:hypothetical protein